MEVLTIEQMTKLKELGVNASEASMCYTFFESEGEKIQKLFVHNEDCYEFSSMDPVPTFDLKDIIEMLPYSIYSNGVNYHLVMLKTCALYHFIYENVKGELYHTKSAWPLQSANEMLVLVASNGQLKQ